MRKRTNHRFPSVFLVLACAVALACIPKAKPTKIQLPSGEVIEGRELRAWTYDVTNRLSGRIETAADRIQATAEDAAVRRAALDWKAGAIPAMQRASFHPDPVVALVDIWLLIVQMRDFIEGDRGVEKLGPYVTIARDATVQMEQDLLDFMHDKGGRPEETGAKQLVYDFARRNPIVDSLTARPSAVPALADRLRSGKMGAFAAVGSLVEGFADLSDRLSIYGEQLPKQARWQAEMLLFDRGLEQVDVDRLVDDLSRLGVAADTVVELVDDVPRLVDESAVAVLPHVERMIESIDLSEAQKLADEMIAAQLTVALEAVTGEREVILEVVHQERVETLADVERIANTIVDSSFERVDAMIDARLGRLVPLGAALMAGPFLLGLLAGWVLRRRPAP